MTEKPRWIERFAAFAAIRCRDLPGSIDRTTDRSHSDGVVRRRRPRRRVVVLVRGGLLAHQENTMKAVVQDQYGSRDVARTQTARLSSPFRS